MNGFDYLKMQDISEANSAGRSEFGKLRSVELLRELRPAMSACMALYEFTLINGPAPDIHFIPAT